jgi:hypothetical protein
MLSASPVGSSIKAPVNGRKGYPSRFNTFWMNYAAIGSTRASKKPKISATAGIIGTETKMLS